MLEADYCINLEYDHEVVRYTTNVPSIKFLVGNKLHSYTADFIVETQESINYIEIKPDFTTLSARTQEKLNRGKEALSTQGTPLRYASLETIRNGCCFRNKEFLYFNSFHVSRDELGYCMQFISEIQYPTSISEIIKNNHHPSLKSLYLAIFIRQLDFNMKKIISPVSLLQQGVNYPNAADIDTSR